MTIVRAQLEPGTPVTRDAAVRQAVRTYPGGVPRGVVLVYLKTAGDPTTRVAWAVHFDPSKLPGLRRWVRAPHRGITRLFMPSSSLTPAPVNSFLAVTGLDR